MRKILVPTDFSQNAFTAFRYAYEFASIRQCDIDYVHFLLPQAEVSELPNISGSASAIKIQYARSLASSAVETMRQIFSIPEGQYVPSITIDIVMDLPVHGVNNWVQEHNTDLIICGSRGENLSFKDKLLGTVSGGLSQKSKCPILYIPTDFHYVPISFIGYASNLSFHDPYEIWRALKIFKPDNPITHCIHINDNNSSLEDKYADEMEEYLLKNNEALQLFFHEIEGQNVQKQLIAAVEKYKLDILIMTKRKQNFFERLISKSHTKSMLKKIHIPLLVLNDI